MSTGKQVFEYEREGDVLIVTPTGSLMEFRDSDVRDAYNETYRQLSDDDIKHLLIDFSKLSYFASTFVGMLIRLAKKARQGGGEAVLCQLSDNMRDMMKTLMLLENTKTDFFWVPFNSREEAIAKLHKDSPAAQAEKVDPPAPAPEAGGGWAKFAK